MGLSPLEPQDDDSRRIDAVAENITNTRSQAETAYDAARDEGKSRSQITSVVVWTWASSIGAYAIACFVTVFRAGFEPEAAQAAVVNISELIKVGVLPLTAIVIGYYLSRSSA